MERPTRKQNRLSEYRYGQVGSYFVTICTQNRACLFALEQTDDAGSFPTLPLQNQILHRWIRETKNKYSDIRIENYVIMPDHLHMIVTIDKEHSGCILPDVIRFFKTMSTNEYIRAVKDGFLPRFQGKIWQKSYYDHVIRNQTDYNEIWEYIRNNPDKWILVHSNGT